MGPYSSGTLLTLGGLGALVSVALGALIHAWWLRRVARERRRIPRRWPLSQRLVANSEERKVWRWLTHAFAEHAVMIKMPVTRFTLPMSKKHGLHWFELLSGLYCTFTVITPAGQVIGCVDVRDQLRLARKTRILKETLLNQCGIAYMVLESAHLPSTRDIRIQFLGEAAFVPNERERQRDEAAIQSASMSLRESLQRQRKTRDSGRTPLTPNSESGYDSRNHSDSGSHFSVLWQENSFIMPLDSRKGDLH